LSIVSIDYIAWIRPHVVTLIAELLCQPITKVTAIRCIALSIEVVVPLVPLLLIISVDYIAWIRSAPIVLILRP
jgi:hypothetical protein